MNDNLSLQGIKRTYLNLMDVKIDESWKQHIGAEFDKPYFAALTAFVRASTAAARVIRPGGLYSTPSTFVLLTK